MGWAGIRDWFFAPCYWAVNSTKRSIAKEFTRASLNVQKRLARTVALNLKSDIYIFDESDYFRGAKEKLSDNIRYLELDGRYAVLSMAAQKVMKNSNEYKQFVTDVDDVTTDSIGVKFLLSSALETQIKNYRDKLITKRDSANVHVIIAELRRLLQDYDIRNPPPQEQQPCLIETSDSELSLDARTPQERIKSKISDLLNRNQL